MAKEKQKKHPLWWIRRVVAALFFTAIIVLLCGAFNWAPKALGWVARLQFIPAVLALNAGAFIVVLLATVLFGRIYCSVFCPLGVLQDVAIGAHDFKKNRFKYKKPLTWLRYTVLILFIVALAAGFSVIAGLIEPYSMFGRMVSLASHPTSAAVKVVGGVSLILIILLAWFLGRWWCNSICPVGTLLGLLSRFSLFKPVIDTEKCTKCRKCERNCKTCSIDIKGGMKIDYSRCVTCMDCLSNCQYGAMKYRMAPVKGGQPKAADGQDKATGGQADAGRRAFIAGSLIAVGTAAVKAQEMKMDGGLADIIDKKVPNRQTRITPPGSQSARNMYSHCTACQLCVDNCPNHVLRPSTDLKHFMQPESSYERGYCRPECSVCSEICPVGAIRPLTVEEKSSTQVGHAVWVRENCVVVSDKELCGNCARHCPTGAIQMVDAGSNSKHKDRRGRDIRLQIPIVDEERCIGCGACENLCPSRPFSAIYVEGHQVHKTV
ncbi:MAG: 4Fe-4S binding protein [Bacteroidaceae bacterium]|nr:4Fe-4S binding protein [Bacteroidaceae bacterium]